MSPPPSTPVTLSPSREHKVHNIMLYPEKHSWCKPTPIKQVVTHPGCKSIDMENNICVGACFSFSVPRTIPETPGDDQLYYCDSCQPLSVAWTTVLLECPDTLTQEPISKMVEVITNCSCNTYRNIEMYENQLSDSNFNHHFGSNGGGGGADDVDAVDDDTADDEDQTDTEEDEEDNSLLEINDFISRHEKLKLKKPIMTSSSSLGALTSSIEVTKTNANDINGALTIANAQNASISISLSNVNTSSESGWTTQKPKPTHSDELQFQKLSAETEPEVETEMEMKENDEEEDDVDSQQ
ncbi:hypothetical protein CHUAL_011342 [Chamberlinius hualienensis]